MTLYPEATNNIDSIVYYISFSYLKYNSDCSIYLHHLFFEARQKVI